MKPRALPLAASILLAAAAACHDSPTQPATPSQSPTPVPVALDLNGTWTGTIDYDPSGDSSCPLRENVEITFTQVQDMLYAQVRTHCFQTIELDGKLALDRSQANLTLRMFLGNDIEIASMTGTATKTQIDASTRSALSKGDPVSLLLTR
jgi:dienelactone hydrolase